MSEKRYRASIHCRDLQNIVDHVIAFIAILILWSATATAVAAESLVATPPTDATAANSPAASATVNSSAPVANPTAPAKPAPTISPPANTAAGVAPAAPDCAASKQSPTTSNLLINVLPKTAWQPPDGRVQFTVTAPEGKVPSAIDTLKIQVCFGWPKQIQKSADKAEAQQYYHSTYLRTVARSDTSVTFETNLPDELWAGKADSWRPNLWSSLHYRINTVLNRPRHVFDGWGLIPIVNMRVTAQSQVSSGTSTELITQDAVLPVGVSSHLIALLMMILSVGIFWAILLGWAQRRGIPGRGILKVISNRKNYASLSQFQIVLWTIVIGGGAVYVMSLTGSLIDIPDQALALLGIAGFSALSATYHLEHRELAPPTPASTSATPAAKTSDRDATAPGAVRDLEALSIGDTRAVLAWRQPAGAGSALTYEVTFVSMHPAKPDHPKIHESGGEPYAEITGLNKDTKYKFSVTSVVAPDSKSDPVFVEFNTLHSERAAVPMLDTHVRLPQDDYRVEVTWTSPDPWDSVLIQYRQARTSAWTTDYVGGPASAAPFRPSDLNCKTPYEFRVRGAATGHLGDWSNIATATTGSRIPRWSDLVFWAGTSEVDVPRVQMLAFTILAAGFVALKIGDESIIPEIPNSVVILMGLSNGVYVGGKLVVKQKPEPNGAAGAKSGS